MLKRNYLYLGLILLTTAGCTGTYHANNLHSAGERETTLGIVQKDIHKGMGQDEVAILLGSPNIVTKSQDGMDTWIYDKIATEVSYSNSQSGIGGVLGGVWSVVVGGATGSVSQNSGAQAQTQKTLIVTIKFDQNKAVDTVAYRSSKF